MPDCTCWPFRNRRHPYDPACPYHGDEGTMVVEVRLNQYGEPVPKEVVPDDA